MAEVSEQEQLVEKSVQETSQEPASVEGEALEVESAQEPLPVPEKASEEPVEVLEPSELAELTRITELLRGLAKACEHIQDALPTADEQQTQELLMQLAVTVAFIPKALQLLHDYRRHQPSFDARAQNLYKGLQAARLGHDALSSEEKRVIAAVASLRETLLESIYALEQALTHVRTNAHELLSVVAYSADDSFASFAQPRIQQVDVGYIKHVALGELQRMLCLHRDVVELRAFEAHLEELVSND